MTMENKRIKILESLSDYLTEKEFTQVNIENARNVSLIIAYYGVHLFELSFNELKPSLLDTYAYMIARVIHFHKVLENTIQGKI